MRASSSVPRPYKIRIHSLTNAYKKHYLLKTSTILLISKKAQNLKMYKLLFTISYPANAFYMRFMSAANTHWCMYTSIWWYLRVLPVLHRPEVVDIGVNTI